MSKGKPKILLVDDNIFFLRLLSRVFLAAGFIVQAASEATAALSEAKKTQADIIMLEILLPDEDGLSILKKLKRSKETAKTPVVIFTTVHSAPHREQAKVFGAAGYFLKALSDPAEIVTEVKALLQLK